MAAKIMPRLPPQVDRDDLVSAGMLGLLSAARRFQPDLGVPFAAFAARRVHGAMVDCLRALDPLSRAQRKARRADQAARGEYLGDAQLDDHVTRTAVAAGPSPERLCLERERDAWLAHTIATLPRRDQLILQYRYADGESQAEVAARLGISLTRVSQLEARAVRQVRQAAAGLSFAA